MKKLFIFLTVACALIACDPVSEDITNDGHITVEQLMAMTSVTVDKAASGKNGNVITCTTSAPVNAKWSIGGKEFYNNYAWKKMKIGEYTVTLTGLCADGTLLTADYTINCEEITNQLERFWIYGEDPVAQPPFTPGNWDGSQMLFSDNEGKHFPYLSDDVYWGFKTLIFDLSGATSDCKFKVHNGWWSTDYMDGVVVPQGDHVLWELPITEAIAKDCARGNGGGGKDLQIIVTSGSVTINAVYYEE